MVDSNVEKRSRYQFVGYRAELFVGGETTFAHVRWHRPKSAIRNNLSDDDDGLASVQHLRGTKKRTYRLYVEPRQFAWPCQ